MLADELEFLKNVKEQISLIQEVNKTYKTLPATFDAFDEQVFDNSHLKINMQYPNSKDFYFDTFMSIINLDEECKKDLATDKGFIVSDFRPITKELKSENGIFSPKFGQTLGDANPFINRYRCLCGEEQGRFNLNKICKKCGKPVKYVGDDFGYFGWIILNNCSAIHPNLYKNLEALIGPQRLINILDAEDIKDENGNKIDKPNEVLDKKFLPKRKNKGPNEPFFGLGIMEFESHFQEICDYYFNLAGSNVKKKEHYYHIMDNKDKVFIHCIPVYSLLLRPVELSDNKTLSYEGTNGYYNMISKYATCLNNVSLRIFRQKKERNALLYNLQIQLMELYKEIDNILSGKKGNVRQLAGGRFNFSSRDVIIQNPKLRIDEVTLPYPCLVDILEQRIINVLVKTYNMSYNKAHDRWYKAVLEKDELVVEIIKGLLFSDDPRGMKVIINRNPTIQRGSILCMHCVGMTFGHTMALPLQVLPLLAADFDGDVLNVYSIITKAFGIRAEQVLNPRNAMYISNNDGRLNKDVIPAREILINSTSLVSLGRPSYTREELEMIEACLQ